MKIVYRIVAIVLTLASAGTTALLITAATDPDGKIKVLPFTLFAVGAAVALILALVLWQRSNTVRSRGPREERPPSSSTDP